MQDFLSRDELCRALGITDSTLYRWIRDGKLPRPLKRKSPLAVWPRADVQAIIDRRRGQAVLPFGAAA